MRRKQIALCILLVTSTGAACNTREAEPIAPPEGAPTAPMEKPIDHLAAGELVPGTERAFTLTLPRGFVVRARFADSVLAEGPASAVHLGRYVADRVKDGQANVQPARALFEGVRTPEEPNRVLRIRIEEPTPGFCRLQLNDDTPLQDPGGDVAERLKRIGRAPDGKLEGRDKME